MSILGTLWHRLKGEINAKAPQSPVESQQASEVQTPQAVPPRLPTGSLGPRHSSIPISDADLEVMARTLWAECRLEPDQGQVAVAWVIRNRATHPRWWGRSVKEVCLKPWQFSCWNKDDPQYKRIRAPELVNDPRYRHSLEICRDVLGGYLDDTSLGSDHYVANHTIAATKWAKGRTPQVKIGGHSFYTLEIA